MCVWGGLTITYSPTAAQPVTRHFPLPSCCTAAPFASTAIGLNARAAAALQGKAGDVPLRVEMVAKTRATSSAALAVAADRSNSASEPTAPMMIGVPGGGGVQPGGPGWGTSGGRLVSRLNGRPRTVDLAWSTGATPVDFEAKPKELSGRSRSQFRT